MHMDNTMDGTSLINKQIILYDHLVYIPDPNFEFFYILFLYREPGLAGAIKNYDSNLIIDIFNVMFNTCDVVSVDNDYNLSFDINLEKCKGTAKFRFVKYDASNLCSFTKLKVSKNHKKLSIHYLIHSLDDLVCFIQRKQREYIIKKSKIFVHPVLNYIEHQKEIKNTDKIHKAVALSKNLDLVQIL